MSPTCSARAKESLIAVAIPRCMGTRICEMRDSLECILKMPCGKEVEVGWVDEGRGAERKRRGSEFRRTRETVGGGP